MLKEGFVRFSDIIKPFTGIEFVDSSLLDAAADKGTYVHQIIEGIVKNGLIQPIIEDEYQGYIDSFFKFWDDSSHAFEGMKSSTEERFYDEDLKYTGAIDCIFFNKVKTYLLDWKTSSKPQKSWALQGAAYRHLLEKSGYQDVTVMFIHLTKKGKPKVHTFENYQEDWRIFSNCLELYHYFQMDKTRRPYGD